MPTDQKLNEPTNLQHIKIRADKSKLFSAAHIV